jgi:hypothetical protein
LFQASLTRKIHETPQKSLWILLDFLVRIERFQGVALTPRPEISFMGSSPRNNGTRPLISRDRAPGDVRPRRLACAADRAFHGDEDHSTDSDFLEEKCAQIVFRPVAANRGQWIRLQVWVE